MKLEQFGDLSRQSPYNQNSGLMTNLNMFQRTQVDSNLQFDATMKRDGFTKLIMSRGLPGGINYANAILDALYINSLRVEKIQTLKIPKHLSGDSASIEFLAHAIKKSTGHIEDLSTKVRCAYAMENQDLMLMNVLCISTIEHIGTTDYATNERQNIVDKNAAINALKQILDDGENCLISIPIGYNHFLDSWLEENLDILNCFAYKKVLWILNNNLGHTVNPNGNGELHIRTDTPDGVKSLWNYYADVKSIKGEKYREPFPAGNYVLFIEGWK